MCSACSTLSIGLQESLKLTAEASGGFAIVDTNEFQSGLSRVIADLDNYYMLGFYPEDPTDKSWHKLEVSVNRLGMTVRHRIGYRSGVAPRLPKNKDPLVQLSAGVLPRTDLPLRLAATPVALSSKSARVAVTVEFSAPRAALRGRTAASPTPFT